MWPILEAHGQSAFELQVKILIKHVKAELRKKVDLLKVIKYSITRYETQFVQNTLDYKWVPTNSSIKIKGHI